MKYIKVSRRFTVITGSKLAENILTPREALKWEEVLGRHYFQQQMDKAKIQN